MNTTIIQQVQRLRYWLACVILIVMLSVYGRKLQYVITAKVDALWIAGIVFFVLFAALLNLYRKRKTTSIPNVVLVLSFCLLCSGGAAVYFKYLLPVEALHFLVFSCYGWFSSAVFGAIYGMVAVFGMAFGDEVLQYYLPSRVGDLHDVLINSLSGVTGLILRNKL